MTSALKTAAGNIRRSLREFLAGGAILGIGLAVSGATFAIVDGVFLKPPPFQSPENLYVVGPQSRFNAGRPGSTTRAELDELGGAVGVAGAAAFDRGLFDPRKSEPEGLSGARVTPGFFELLGVRLKEGRYLDRSDGHSVPLPVVVSENLFRARFGNDLKWLGRRTTLGGLDVTLVGIVDGAAAVPADANVWAPLISRERPFTFRHLTTIARIPDRRSTPQLAGAPLVMIPIRTFLAPPEPEATTLLLLVTGLVTITGWLNVSMLVGRRMVSNLRQHAIKLTLGATPSRLAAENVAETGILCISAIGLASLLTKPFLSAILATLPGTLNVGGRISADYRTVLYQVAAAIITLLTAAFVMRGAAWRHHSHLHELAGIGGRRMASSGQLRLLVLQSAVVAVVIYVAAASLRSYEQFKNVDLGFDPRGLFSVWLPDTSPANRQLVVESLERSLGEQSVTFGVSPLGSGRLAVRVLADPPRTPDDLRAREQNGDERWVADDYLQVAGIPVVEGRGFAPDDPAGTTILSATLAKSIGATVRDVVFISGTSPAFVVGIADDVRVDGPASLPRGIVYRLIRETSSLLLIRHHSPASVRHAVDSTALNMLGSATPPRIESLETVYVRYTAGQRSRALLMGLACLSSVLLAVFGVAHVARAYATQELRESAVRISLGAPPRREGVRFLSKIGRATLTGAVVGTCVGLAVTKGYASLFFSLQILDLSAFLACIGGVVAAALAISLRQALAMVHVDPVVLLRSE